MPRAGLNRDRLIQAGAQLADEVGFGGLTLAALARQFEVKLASIYSHMNNTDDLRIGVARLAWSEMASLLEQSIAGRSSRDALIAIATAYREFAGAHPGLFEALRYKLEPKLAAESDQRIDKVLFDMLWGYHLTDPARIHAARLLGSYFTGFCLLEEGGAFSHREPGSEVSWESNLDTLDAMLTALGSGIS